MKRVSLIIATQSATSTHAIHNLHTALHTITDVDVEIINAHDHPDKVIEHHAYLTPTLHIHTPHTDHYLIGNLTNHNLIRTLLQHTT